jgi:hypothetical protein
MDEIANWKCTPVRVIAFLCSTKIRLQPGHQFAKFAFSNRAGLWCGFIVGREAHQVIKKCLVGCAPNFGTVSVLL